WRVPGWPPAARLRGRASPAPSSTIPLAGYRLGLTYAELPPPGRAPDHRGPQRCYPGTGILQEGAREGTVREWVGPAGRVADSAGGRAPARRAPTPRGPTGGSATHEPPQRPGEVAAAGEARPHQHRV